MDAMIAYVELKEPVLWGLVKPRDFVRRQVYIAQYKYAYAVGYDKLTRMIHSWNKLPEKSVTHNAQQILRCLKKWGKSKVQLGTKTSWFGISKQYKMPKQINDAHLLMDSTDFRLSGKCSTSRKDVNWSYKENSPAQRFTLLHTMDGKIVQCWGGYSPKVYDSDFVIIQKNFFDSTLKGAVVIADCHYASAGKQLEHCKFLIPFEKPKNSKKAKETGVGLKKLTKKQQSWNKAV